MRERLLLPMLRSDTANEYGHKLINYNEKMAPRVGFEPTAK